MCKRGFLDGWRGFLLAVLYAYYVFLRMAKAWEPGGAGTGTVTRRDRIAGARAVGDAADRQAAPGQLPRAPSPTGCKLQDGYDCFYFVADWHVLTDRPGRRGDVPGNTIEMAADWLGAGLDPERSTLFIQSLVPEHAELHLLFSMVTPVGWLERVPTYKEMVEQHGIESPSYGLLGYPLLQSADILMYKARWVPVGRRPGAARRADPRGGAAVQQHVRPSCSRSPRPS